MALDGAAETAFSDLAGDLDYPMTIVTARAGRRMAGCLVGFATQCSIHPPRFAVWVSRQNHTFSVADEAAVLAVHFLSTDQRELAALFGSQTGDDTDKFAECRWHEGPGGAPVLDGCARWFAGEVVDRFPTGDHVGFVLAPVGVGSGPWSGQLGFQSVRSTPPGHPA